MMSQSKVLLRHLMIWHVFCILSMDIAIDNVQWWKYRCTARTHFDSIICYLINNYCSYEHVWLYNVFHEAKPTASISWGKANCVQFTSRVNLISSISQDNANCIHCTRQVDCAHFTMQPRRTLVKWTQSFHSVSHIVSKNNTWIIHFTLLISGGTSVSSSKSIIGRSNRFDNRDDIGFRGDDGVSWF